MTRKTTFTDPAIFQQAGSVIGKLAANHINEDLKARVEAADKALQFVSVTLGGTDEWTDQETMIQSVKRTAEESKARAEAAEKHIAFLRDALGDERQSVWRDVKLSAATEEAVSTVLEWRARAERLAAVLERIANESLYYEDIARAALEAKP